ncbi:transposase [Hansschlegelia sp. KR7-227]|jgi:putative transposase|uniref:transposase n=1 Tax=Hansschlegelia sp. KR7-227 TaxID=3400914 RepID=UPI003C01148A
MPARRLTDEEIAVLLEEVARGASMETVCVDAHVSVRTFYRWKRQFEGLTPSGVRHLRALRQENSELRRVLAELSARPAGGARLPATHRRRPARNAGQREMCGVSVGRFATVRLV